LDAITALKPAKSNEAQSSGQLSTGLPGDMLALLTMLETPLLA